MISSRCENGSAMFEIDHIFVCTDAGGPGADRLVELGLSEAKPNRHPGQGTSCRRFVFDNAMLELLWIHDEREARSDLTQRTRLMERWSQRNGGACPFGICFRTIGTGTRAPFATWTYSPDYLPGPLAIHIATNSDVLHEPMLFWMPFDSRPANPPRHRAGFREITRVQWIRPHAEKLSPELEAVASCAELSIASGRGHALQIGFDGESQGRSAALSPALPITLHW